MDVYDVDFVKTFIAEADEDSGGDLIDTLMYADAGKKLDFSLNENWPDGWLASVYEVSTDRDYDSYGNSYTNNAYVIIQIADNAKVALYKIPGEYTSYDGWEWFFNKIIRVEKREKVIKTYEWNEV